MTVTSRTSPIAKMRLSSQRLIGERLNTPRQVVGWFGAVQAQDYPNAKWGIAQRMHSANDANLDAAFNAGEIVRTHVMRPTWHFVAPEDLRWLLALTGPRVQAANARVYRNLELDDVVLRRTSSIIAKALAGGRNVTRSEIGEVFNKKGVDARGQRLAYIMMNAELNALVCSGPLRGKQHTYVLIDERVPPAPKLDRDQALQTLALRYFTSHGPATARDFAWWSGLTISDAKRALAAAADEVAQLTVDDVTYYWRAETADVKVRRPVVHMLPNYDEHVVAYRDHGPSLDPRAPRVLDNWGNALTSHLIVLNGLVVGGWRRRLGASAIELNVTLPIALSASEKRALQREAERYAAYMSAPVTFSESGGGLYD